MKHVASLGVPQWTMHIDLHETTDSDLSEFRPAKAARDGVGYFLLRNRKPLRHDSFRCRFQTRPYLMASTSLARPATREACSVGWFPAPTPNPSSFLLQPLPFPLHQTSNPFLIFRLAVGLQPSSKACGKSRTSHHLMRTVTWSKSQLFRCEMQKRAGVVRSATRNLAS